VNCLWKEGEPRGCTECGRESCEGTHVPTPTRAAYNEGYQDAWAESERLLRRVAEVEAERDACRRSHLAAEKDCTRALRRVARLEARLARVLRVAYWLECRIREPGRVWSRRRSGG
jgi:hypothetical protein